MKRLFYTVLAGILFSSCASTLYPKYVLTKKYPLETPDLILEISSDTTGTILMADDNPMKQDFSFSKEKKNYLVIRSIGANSLVSLKKGDTLVYHKKELYIMNKHHKLVFTKK